MALYNAGSPPSSPPRVPYWHNESINSGRFERARADASAWADSSNDAIAAQVTQIKELERELQALKLQAESERRFAESQAENSKDARAAKPNAELDRLTVDLEAEGRRSRQLATKVEQARERLYGLKKQASQPAAQMSTGRARTRRLANLAGQLTRTQRKCDEVYAAMKQLKDEARTLETEKSTFEAKLRSLQEEASEHYYEASKAAREYNAANRARDDEVQQTEQLAKQEEAGVKRREAAQKALADAMGAAEKRRALVTSRRKAAISASYAATSSAGGAKSKAYAKEPEVFLATAKPARTLRDVVDRVGQYLGVPQQLGAIVERVLAGAAEERRMVAELKAGRETLAADEAEVARLKVELAGKKGTPNGAGGASRAPTELQAAGAKLVAQEEVAQRAVRGVEKEAAALCALLDCEPTPIVRIGLYANVSLPSNSTRSAPAARPSSDDRRRGRRARRRAGIWRRARPRRRPAGDVPKRRGGASLRRRGIADQVADQVPGARDGGGARRRGQPHPCSGAAAEQRGARRVGGGRRAGAERRAAADGGAAEE